MRIVHLVPNLHPSSGGPPVVAFGICRELEQLGHEVRLSGISASLTQFPNAQVFFLPRSLSSFYLELHRQIDSLVNLISWSDVVHIHGIWEPMVLRAASLCRLVGRPFVITPHGMLDPWSLSQKKWKKRIALAVIYKSLLNNATLHLLNSDESSLIAPLQLTSNKVVIPNGLDPGDAESSMPELFRDTIPELNHRRYVLFLGRLHFKKGLDILSIAWERVAHRHPGVDLVVCGPDDGARHSFNNAIASAGLSNRVHLPGPVYGPMKWSALAGASVFVLPSRQEGFSVAILEALASGLPAVVTQQCHFPEVAEAGYVTELNPEAFARGLDDLLSYPERARQFGERGRQLVAEKYTWSKIAKQFEALYESIISKTH